MFHYCSYCLSVVVFKLQCGSEFLRLCGILAGFIRDKEESVDTGQPDCEFTRKLEFIEKEGVIQTFGNQRSPEN